MAKKPKLHAKQGRPDLLAADLLASAAVRQKPPQSPRSFDPAALPNAARHRFPAGPKPLKARTRPVPAHSSGGWWSI